MKRLSTLCLLALVLPGTAKAAVILTVTSNIPIPQDHAGLYLNVFTGATAGSEPTNWNLEPWMNPFQGGVYVGNSLYLRPVIKGADQIENLAPGTMIDNTKTYAPGESGSDKHMGPAADQFQPKSVGYVGFQMQANPTADIHYGWLQVTFDNTGAGSITSYAYESIPGQAILAGLPIPEPSGALLLCSGSAAALSRRRRPWRSHLGLRQPAAAFPPNSLLFGHDATGRAENSDYAAADRMTPAGDDLPRRISEELLTCYSDARLAAGCLTESGSRLPQSMVAAPQ